MKVHVHIERLVLDGLSLGRVPEASLRDAVTGQLERELVERDIGAKFARPASVAYLAGPDLPVAASSTPEDLGRNLGHAIASSLETGSPAAVR